MGVCVLFSKTTPVEELLALVSEVAGASAGCGRGGGVALSVIVVYTAFCCEFQLAVDVKGWVTWLEGIGRLGGRTSSLSQVVFGQLEVTSLHCITGANVSIMDECFNLGGSLAALILCCSIAVPGSREHR
jgi:hypothetical protein